jgi:hypothetical protein
MPSLGGVGARGLSSKDDEIVVSADDEKVRNCDGKRSVRAREGMRGEIASGVHSSSSRSEDADIASPIASCWDTVAVGWKFFLVFQKFS